MSTTQTSRSEHRAVHITLGVHPIPQPRPRFNKGRVFETAAIRKYKEAIRTQVLIDCKTALFRGLLPFKGAVGVCIELLRNDEPVSKRFGDADNHAKALLDALTGICYLDDAQVVNLVVNKTRRTVEGVRIIVTEV